VRGWRGGWSSRGIMRVVETGLEVAGVGGSGVGSARWGGEGEGGGGGGRLRSRLVLCF